MSPFYVFLLSMVSACVLWDEQTARVPHSTHRPLNGFFTACGCHIKASVHRVQDSTRSEGRSVLNCTNCTKIIFRQIQPFVLTSCLILSHRVSSCPDTALISSHSFLLFVGLLVILYPFCHCVALWSLCNPLCCFMLSCLGKGLRYWIGLLLSPRAIPSQLFGHCTSIHLSLVAWILTSWIE